MFPQTPGLTLILAGQTHSFLWFLPITHTVKIQITTSNNLLTYKSSHKNPTQTPINPRTMLTFNPTNLLLLPYLSLFVLAHAPDSDIHAIISSAINDYDIATSAISSIFSMATAPASADVGDITSFANSVYAEATAAVGSVFHQATSGLDSLGDDITSGVGSLGDKITSVAAEVTSTVVSLGKFVTSGVGGVVSEASGGVGSSVSEAIASATPTKQVTGKESTFTMTRAPGSGTVTPTSVSEGRVTRREKYADGLLAAAIFAAVAFL
ncbi:hypothetical protein D6D05_07294 [Aureobasidium pullulans]|nr:hypothetical protein D6D05_07294 [Aureobasidium pullulans]